MHNNTNNSDRMNTVAYKIGQAIALVVCLCVSSIVIAFNCEVHPVDFVRRFCR